MPNNKPTYHEHLLHWIWESLHFNLTRLRTPEGQPVTIANPGSHNRSDGPDFLNAELKIGSIQWYGDVEIHWQEQDWNYHHHDRDPNFNRVVLHVVYHADGKNRRRVCRQDQTSIPTLSLKPYLTRSLQAFLEQFNQRGTLPCAGHTSFIFKQAFQQQLEKAQKQYFEQKVDDLFHFYDPSLPPSRAWTNLLALGLFDGLGIAHNREPMKWLCNKLLTSFDKFDTRTEFINQALSLAGLAVTSSHHDPGWKHKNCRPANHPNARIRQASECLWYVRKVPFGYWLKKDVSWFWKELIGQIQTRPGLGKERADILFGTVWLPAFFILGNLFNSEQLRSKAYSGWMNHQTKLPSSLLRPFSSMEIPADTYQYNLGAIHQLRSYCKPRRCTGCEVFKNVISS